MSLGEERRLDVLVCDVLVDVLALFEQLADVCPAADAVGQLRGCVADEAEDGDVGGPLGLQQVVLAGLRVHRAFLADRRDDDAA